MTTNLHPEAKTRRDELRTKGLCINGADHGKATHGQLCWPCRCVHRGICKTRAEAPPQCDFHDDHDLTADKPTGTRCNKPATHRLAWEDGRFSFGCAQHLTIDDSTTVKLTRIDPL